MVEKHEVTRNSPSERGGSAASERESDDEYDLNIRVGENFPQIMKLCCENVYQFPYSQRTNYRTKKENVSFVTSKWGLCLLIFPLFASCCFT